MITILQTLEFHPEHLKIIQALENAGTTILFAVLLMAILSIFYNLDILVKIVHKFFSKFLQKKNKLIRRTTAAVYLSGVLIYIVGYYKKGFTAIVPIDEATNTIIEHTNTFGEHILYMLTIIVRSCISSLEMFVSRSDLRMVTDTLREDPIYMSLFVFIHLFAIILSVGFILSFISYRNKVTIIMKGWKKNKDKNVYIFWGINSPSIQLAKSINEKKKLANESPQIVFVTEDDHATEKNYRLSFTHLLGSGHAGATYISTVEKLGGVVIAFDENSTYERFAKMARQGKLLNFMFFSDDETFNLSRASKIMNNKIFTDLKKQIYTYCHARRELVNMSLSDKDTLSVINTSKESGITIETGIKLPHFNLVDSSIYAVELLKVLPEAQPVNFVDIETITEGGKTYSTGIVKSAFNALIIGFSETGQAALSFLYEHGTFPNSKGTRSDFHCLVIDKAMKEIEGTYYTEKPALRGDSQIQLEQAEVGSFKYWELIEKVFKKTNYVIIALGDDKLNTTIAIELYNYALRINNGTLPKHFVIYVRLNKRKKEDRQYIKSVYFNPEMKENCIRFFGAEEDVFSEDMVIHKNDYQQAKIFEDCYHQFNRKYEVKDNEEKIPENDTLPKTKTYPDLFSAAKDMTRRFEQNLSNAHHIYTKVALLNNNGQLNDDLIKSIAQLERQPSTKEFDGKYWYGNPNSIETRIMYNLALCEHLRWVSELKMKGYTYDANATCCNVKSMKHNCLTSWDNLIKRWKDLDQDPYNEYICYDYNVVETSIKIYLEKK